MKEKNLWERWDREVEKFRNVAKEYQTPADIVIEWRRRFLLIFMQELSKNLLKGSFDLLLDKIIEAIQLGTNFNCVRVYLVDERNTDELYLYKKSKDHEPIDRELRLKIERGKDDAVDTLFSGDPLLIDDIDKVELLFKEYLKLRGPYAAIPLLVEGSPVGLICANMTPWPKLADDKLAYSKHSDFFEEAEAFVRSIMAAVENRKIFEQRNQKIKQLKLIDKLSELIQSESEKEKLLTALVQYSVKLVDGTGGNLKLRSEKTGKWERAFVYGSDVVTPEVTDKPDELGFYNLALEEKKSLIINDLDRHPLMIKNKDFCSRKGYKEYLKKLENRKSALFVPLIKQNKEIIGVMYVHSNQNNKFRAADKENLSALVNSVIDVIDRTQQLEQQRNFLKMRDGLLAMLHEAVGKADNLNSVLSIIRNSCHKIMSFKDIHTVCLSIKDPHTNELITPSVKCFRAEDKDCVLCFKQKGIIEKAFKEKKLKEGDNDLALPILLADEVIGVLYLQGDNKIILDPGERKILEIITNTAAILIKTARNYEIKIRQLAAIYEAAQFTIKMRDFREWFYYVMEHVMAIIGRKNRNFHLALIEEHEGKEKLIIKASGPYFVGGKKIDMEKKLLGREIPLDSSLCGVAVQQKTTQYIPDVEKNSAKEDDDPTKLKFYDDGTGAKSEVELPLKIKDGEDERVIGVVIIYSKKPNDFHDFDIKFHETIANYLAIAIHEQQLYEDRTKFQEEIRRQDRANELSIILNSFFHDIEKPIGEINSAINLIEPFLREPSLKSYIKTAREKSHRIQFIFREFVDNFAKTAHEKETRKLIEMIVNALEIVEKSSGLGIEPDGNYLQTGLILNCYPASVELAFRSIIHNALKFSRGLPEKERYLEINVIPDKENNFVAIGFESSTIEPLTEDKLKTIFNKSSKRVLKGDFSGGLGLALADLCVKINFGEIKAENVNGKKAVRFTIILPINIDEINKIKEKKNGIVFK